MGTTTQLQQSVPEVRDTQIVNPEGLRKKAIGLAVIGSIVISSLVTLSIIFNTDVPIVIAIVFAGTFAVLVIARLRTAAIRREGARGSER